MHLRSEINTVLTPRLAFPASATSVIDWYGTLRGRIGWTSGPLLFYVLAVPYRVLGSPTWGLLASATLVNALWVGGCAWLLWRRGADEVVLVVSDDRTGVSFGVDVPGEKALDAFRHPFLYVEPFEPLGDAVAV